MGANNIKSVQEKLERDYKALRKYYDDFYGEITVIQDKKTGDTFARVDKVLFNHRGNLSRYLQARQKQGYSLLVPLVFSFCARVDMCSQTETCIFLLQYDTHTLFQEIVHRQKQKLNFTSEELIQLFSTIIQCVNLLRSSNSKEIPSNNSFIYKSPTEIQIIQPIFCDKTEFGFGKSLRDYQQNKYTQQNQSLQVYISPENFELLCRKQSLKAKQNYANNQSLTFTLGMNFLECILLSDLSQFYDEHRKMFDYTKLNMVLQQVGQIYGEDLQKLIHSMTQKSKQQRPNLEQIRQYLRIIGRNREVRITENPIPDFLEKNKNIKLVHINQ